jgi:ribosomal protein L24E
MNIGDDGKLYCKAHRRIPDVVAGIYCQWCGFGPRSSLGKHLLHRHNGANEEYRQQFGPHSVVSDNLLRNRWGVWFDNKYGKPFTKQTVCTNGHRLAGNNVVTNVRSDGRIARFCRQCRNARRRELDSAKRAQRAASTWKQERACPNPVCGVTFMPHHQTQRYCTVKCAQRAAEARRPKQPHPLRSCDWDGEPFQQRRFDQRFCSKKCANDWHNARLST